jgi:16S rRNA (guanine966-N2)-methyltransferase
VERHPRAAKQLRAIKDKLGATAVEIAEADAIRFAASLAPASFDVVFLDPPFDSSLLGDALKLAMPLVAPNGVVYVEASLPLERAIEGEAGENDANPANSENPANAVKPVKPTDPAGQSRSGASLELPPGWTVERQGKAGLVHYHLLRREIDE